MPPQAEAEEMLVCTVEKYRRERHSELSDWMEEDQPEGFTAYDVAEKDFARRMPGTTNKVEFQNKELKKGHV